jgi:hypothetical protein
LEDYITILLGVVGRPVLFRCMGDFNFNAINARQSLRHALVEIHGAVLPTSAAESYL